VPLRPLGLGEILDGAISAIRAHPGAMIGLSAVVVTVSTLIQTLLQYTALRNFSTAVDSTETLDGDAVLDSLAPLVGPTLMAGGITALAQIVLTGVLTTVVYRAVLGEQVPIGVAWAAARGRVPTLLALSLLTGLAIVAAALVVSVPAILLAVLGAPGVVLVLVWFLTVLAIIALGVYVYIVVGVAGPAVVLEGRGVLAAWSRSRRLVKGSFWRVLGILLLMALIVGGIAFAIAIPFAVVSGVADPDNPFGIVPLTIDGIGAILGGTITSPFAAAVVVLLFVDLRIRREGLDIELARAAGLNAGEAPGSATAPPPW
jgi:hypothetical protein